MYHTSQLNLQEKTVFIDVYVLLLGKKSNIEKHTEF